MYSTNGIGGDDRCGVYAIMEILKEFNPYVLFTEDEEKGGIGAIKAINKLERPKVKFIIELDRRGNNDCVFYECGNNDFKKFIESFGFVMSKGTFSDISILGSYWDIAAVNLSCGYYEEHTKYEYIKLRELLSIIERVKGILRKNYEKVPYFDYQDIYIKSYYDNDLSYLEQELFNPFFRSQISLNHQDNSSMHRKIKKNNSKNKKRGE